MSHLCLCFKRKKNLFCTVFFNNIGAACRAAAILAATLIVLAVDTVNLGYDFRAVVLKSMEVGIFLSN